jgi:putative endonuclease
MNVLSKRQVGEWGETVAADYLVQNGYDVIARNLSCFLGEIDLVATRGEHLFFVEIKLRLNDEFGSALEAVSPVKQSKIRRVAEYFLAEKSEWRNLIPFFSVIAIDALEDGVLNIEFLPDAFT